MRWLALASPLWVSAVLVSCTEYEYEEEMYLSIDGSGEVRVSGSRELLAAFHDIGKSARPEFITEESLRHYFGSPELEIISTRRSTRNGRSYFHVRARFDDLNQLSRHPAFADRNFHWTETAAKVIVTANIEGGQRRRPTSGLYRDGLVSLRIHLPSPVRYHNSPAGIEPGNIIGWEQTLAAHLRGDPLAVEVHFDRRTVLSITLMIIGAALAMVVSAISLTLWSLVRAGRRQLVTEQLGVSSPAGPVRARAENESPARGARGKP
ncbi:MAG: hypothetical protein ACE5JI_10140 [Acidobacteriota bacterium]